ncbi:MAG TPA: hypothetical protein VJM31_01955 [Vicinamibacterales bacterium]|nr:hypothetical protein [Vicinamibacterales bacterium]
MIPSLLQLLVMLSVACSKAPDPLPASVRFEAGIPADHTLHTFAVSRDGRWLAYAAESDSDRRRHIFVRSLEETTQPRELLGTDGGRNPFFSPDGVSIAYFSRGGVWRVPAQGSVAPERIADAPIESAGGTWTDDGRIVFAPLGNQGLMEVPAAGGVAVAVTRLDAEEGEIDHGWPHALSGGRVLFTVSQRGRDPHLEVLSSDGQRTRLRVPVVGQSQFIDTGHLVYGYLGSLMTVRFDADAMAIRGAPTPVAQRLHTSAGYGQLGRAGFAVSRTGTLVWVRAGAEDASSELVRVARDGRYETLAAPAAVYQTPRLSPDGRRLAVVVRSGVMTREIRVLDATRPQRVLFTIRGGDNQSPAWMDSHRLTFGSNRDGLQKIYVATDDRTPSALRGIGGATVARNPAYWIRSPQLLALYEIDAVRRRDALVYRAGGSVEPAAATGANERSPALSPDGKWIAYVSDASGRDEVFVAPLDKSLEPLQMTSSGAVEPVWTREGLFFREADRMMLVTLDSGAKREVFEGHFERDPGANLPAYDVDRQGNFIMLRSVAKPRALRVVRYWAREFD